MLPREARRALEAERDRLQAVKTSLEHDHLDEQSQRGSTGELSGSDEHLADVASETAAREEELGLLAAVVEELAEVDAALVRVGTGTYGFCERCGHPISDARLEAVPGARFCIEDQQRAELDHAVTADHGCARAVEREAFAHLDLLPRDDDLVELSAEESAVTHGRLPRSPSQDLA
jgi:RNA polymerase-binding transcription factor DksA